MALLGPIRFLLGAAQQHVYEVNVNLDGFLGPVAPTVNPQTGGLTYKPDEYTDLTWSADIGPARLRCITEYPDAGYVNGTYVRGRRRFLVTATVFGGVGSLTVDCASPNIPIVVSFPAQEMLLVGKENAPPESVFVSGSATVRHPSITHRRSISGSVTVTVDGRSSLFTRFDNGPNSIWGFVPYVGVNCALGQGTVTVGQFGPSAADTPSGRAFETVGVGFLRAEVNGHEYRQIWTESADGKTGTLSGQMFYPTWGASNSGASYYYLVTTPFPNPDYPLIQISARPEFGTRDWFGGHQSGSALDPYPNFGDFLTTRIKDRATVQTHVSRWPVGGGIPGVGVAHKDEYGGGDTRWANEPLQGRANPGVQRGLTNSSGDFVAAHEFFPNWRGPGYRHTLRAETSAPTATGAISGEADADAWNTPDNLVLADVRDFGTVLRATRLARLRVDGWGAGTLGGADGWRGLAIRKDKYPVSGIPPNSADTPAAFDTAAAARWQLTLDPDLTVSTAGLHAIVPRPADATTFWYALSRDLTNDPTARRAWRFWRYLRLRVNASTASPLRLVLLTRPKGEQTTLVADSSNASGFREELYVPGYGLQVMAAAWDISLLAGDNNLIIDLAAPNALGLRGSVGTESAALPTNGIFSGEDTPGFDLMGDWSARDWVWLARETDPTIHLAYLQQRHLRRTRDVWQMRMERLTPDVNYVFQELALEEKSDGARTPLRATGHGFQELPTPALTGLPATQRVSPAPFDNGHLLRVLANGRPALALPRGAPREHGNSAGYIDGSLWPNVPDVAAAWQEALDGSAAWTVSVLQADNAEKLYAIYLTPTVTGGAIEMNGRLRTAYFEFEQGYFVTGAATSVVQFNQEVGGQVEGIAAGATSAIEASVARSFTDAALRPPVAATPDADGYFALPALVGPTVDDRAFDPSAQTIYGPLLRHLPYTLGFGGVNVLARTVALHRDTTFLYVVGHLVEVGKGGAIEIDSARQWLHLAAGKRIETRDTDTGILKFTSPEHNVDSWLRLRVNARTGQMAMLGRRGGDVIVGISSDGGQSFTELLTMAATTAQIEWDSERNVLCLLGESGGPIAVRQSFDGTTFAAAVTAQTGGGPFSATLLDMTRDARRGVFVAAVAVGTETRVYQSADLAATWTRLI